MKSLKAHELHVIADVIDALDEISDNFSANITGKLYAEGVSFTLEYDEDNGRHAVAP
jgi:hypothetical protein